MKLIQKESPRPGHPAWRPALLQLVALALPVGLQAATYYKADTTTLANSTDWTPNGTPTLSDICSWQGGTGKATISLANSMNQTLGGSLSCSNLDLRAYGSTTAIILSPDGNTLNLYSSSSANNYCALDQGNGAVSTLINCPVTIYNNAYIRNANGGDLSIGGIIGEAGGARSLTLNGNGGWVNLSGANTYTGGTIMNSGAGNLLTLSGSGTLGQPNTGGLTMPTATTSGVFLDLGGTSQSVGAVNLGQACLVQNGTLNGTSFSGFGLISANLGGSALLTLNNSGKVSVLSGNNSYLGGTTITAGTLLATRPAALPLSGPISLTGTLAVRAGGAGEWTSANLDSLLSYGSLTVNSGGTLGIDTTSANFTYGSAISGPTPANLGLVKLGPNTVTLSGANSYKGKTTIQRGMLTLNGATGSLDASSQLNFSGTGSFNYDNAGASGATSQTLAGPILNAGEATIQTTRTVNQNQVLTFTGPFRSAGATANFINGGDSSGNSIANGFVMSANSPGFVNPGWFYNDADYAYIDGQGTFMRAPVYGSDPDFSAAGTLTAGTHGLLTATLAAQDSLTLKTLKLAGSGVGLTLNSGQTLTLTNNGLLKAGGGTVGTLSGGNLLPYNNGELVVRTADASDSLAISSVVGTAAPARTGTTTSSTKVVTGLSGTADLYAGMGVVVSTNATAGTKTVTTISTVDSASQITLAANAGITGTSTLVFFSGTLTKSGAGTLTLSGANTLAGGVNLNAGQLNINHPAALGGGATNSGTALARLTLNEGTVIDNTSGGSLTMLFKYAMTWNGSFTFIGSSDLNFIDPTGNGNIYVPNDVIVTVRTKDSTLKSASNFSGSPTSSTPTTARLTKNGPGTLFIGSNGGSGLNGGLAVNEGVFAGTGTGAQPDGIFSGPVALGDPTPGNSHVAILDMVTGQQHGAPITVQAGSSATLAIYGENSTTLYGPMVLNNMLTLATPSGTFSHYGVISGSGGLIIGNTDSFVVSGATKTLANAGTVKLFNRNTYTGNTVVNSGTLALGALGAIKNSPLIALAPGTTLDVSATTNFILSGSTTLSASGKGTASSTYARIVGPSAGTVSLGAQPLCLTFTPTAFTGDTAHPALYVSQGTLTLNNNTITVTNNSGTPLGAGDYRLVQVGNGTSGLINENGSPSYPVTVVMAGGGSGLAAYSTASVANQSGNLVMTVVTKLPTSFSNLSLSQTIERGTASVVLNGKVSATNGMAYPDYGETVHVILNGVTNDTTFFDYGGDFSVTVPTASLLASATPYTITYRYGGSATLLGCADTSTALTVSAKTVPTIYYWGYATSLTYGQALSNSTLSGGSASVPGTFSFTAPATKPPAGTYPASGTFTPDDTVNYSTVVVPGAISVQVDPVALTIASPAVLTKTYDGTTAATITGTLTGVLAADAGQVTLVGSGTFQYPAPDTGTNIPVDAGCTLAGAQAANYTIPSQPTGLTGTIIPATLTVKADNLGRPYGVANPPLTYTLRGFQGSDDTNSVGVTGAPVLSTTATDTSPEGTYPITITQGDLAMTSLNYTFALSNGTLRVIGPATWAKGTGLWDIETSTNWTSALGPVTYVDGGAVLFNDAPAGLGPFTVTLSTNVSPYTVTVSNVAKDYVFTGASISGGASLLKQGGGALTLGMPNGYSGGTTVSAGKLFYASKIAFGTGTLTLAGGATWRKITEEGNSASLATTNTLYLSGGFVTTEVPFGGGKDMWLSGPIDGPGGFLVTSDTSGRSLMLAGAKTFSGGVTLGGDGSSYPTVKFDDISSLGTGPLRSELTGTDYTKGGITPTADLSAGVTNTVDLAPSARLVVNASGANNLPLSGPVTEAAGLAKVGPATLTLSGANTYGGMTLVANGTLAIANGNSLGTGTLIITNTGKVELDNADTAHATSLNLGGVYQASGSWGSSSSAASFKNDTYFSGTGIVTVAPAGTVTTVTSTPLNGTNGSSVVLAASVVAQLPSRATVNEGTVTFTVTDGSGLPVATLTSGTVNNGAASATLSLAGIAAGSYGVSADYTPAVSPPNFTASSAAVAGVLRVKDTPAFGNLAASQVTTYGTASVTLSGRLSTVAGPVYPALGETVVATINGISHSGTVTDAIGNFVIVYPVGTSLPVSATPYTITYKYAGNGTTLTPAQNDTSTTLTVNPGAVLSPPRIASFTVSGGNVVLSGTNGTPNGTYSVWSSTDAAAPLSAWVPDATGTFDASGRFAITNGVSGAPRKFFLLKQP